MGGTTAGAIDAPAVLLRGPRELAPGTIVVPPSAAGQARVRIHTVGLCASDLALYDGRYGAPNAYPICFGHEWAGTVEAVGPGTTSSARAIWSPATARCGAAGATAASTTATCAATSPSSA